MNACREAFFNIMLWWYLLPVIITYLYILFVDDQKIHEWKDFFFHASFIPVINLFIAFFVTLRVVILFFKRELF